MHTTLSDPICAHQSFACRLAGQRSLPAAAAARVADAPLTLRPPADADAAAGPDAATWHTAATRQPHDADAADRSRPRMLADSLDEAAFQQQQQRGMPMPLSPYGHLPMQMPPPGMMLPPGTPPHHGSPMMPMYPNPFGFYQPVPYPPVPYWPYDPHTPMGSPMHGACLVAALCSRTSCSGCVCCTKPACPCCSTAYTPTYQSTTASTS